MSSDNSLGNSTATTGDRLEDAVRQVSTAVRKLTTVVRNFPPTAGCYIVAYVGQALLQRLHYETEIQIGFAGWQLGPDRNDVILHFPVPETTFCLGPKVWIGYHAWLGCEGTIVDLTTFQLRRKALELDAVEGVHTTVQWCPEFLILPPNAVRTLKDLKNSTEPGTAYYERCPKLESFVKGREKIDTELIGLGHFLLSAPRTRIISPKDLL